MSLDLRNRISIFGIQQSAALKLRPNQEPRLAPKIPQVIFRRPLQSGKFFLANPNRESRHHRITSSKKTLLISTQQRTRTFAD
jgi:hypothetical protein